MRKTELQLVRTAGSAGMLFCQNNSSRQMARIDNQVAFWGGSIGSGGGDIVVEVIDEQTEHLQWRVSLPAKCTCKILSAIRREGKGHEN